METNALANAICHGKTLVGSECLGVQLRFEVELENHIFIRLQGFSNPYQWFAEDELSLHAVSIKETALVDVKLASGVYFSA